MTRLGRAVVPVTDLDEAIAWYARLGLRVVFDTELFPGFRSVHLGFGDTHDPGIWLFPVDAPEAAQHPSLVLFSDDIDADAALLDDERTDVVAPLGGDPGNRSFQVRDPWGNVVVVSETPARPPSGQSDATPAR